MRAHNITIDTQKCRVVLAQLEEHSCTCADLCAHVDHVTKSGDSLANTYAEVIVNETGLF